MKGSIKCACMRFHRVWNGLSARRAFSGSLVLDAKFYILLCATCKVRGPNAIR
jgi:hypothetical protein